MIVRELSKWVLIIKNMNNFFCFSIQLPPPNKIKLQPFCGLETAYIMKEAFTVTANGKLLSRS